MKTNELSLYGVQEMNTLEMKKTNGGGKLSPWLAYGGILLACLPGAGVVEGAFALGVFIYECATSE